MVPVFERTGGLVSGDTLAALVRDYTDQPIAQVARRIVKKSVLSFMWRSTVMLPLLQFEPKTLACREGFSAVLAEWSGVMEDWYLALWFSRANASLSGCTPADAFMLDPVSVLQTARLDRFVQRW